ncbi:hypothetical protein WDW37_20475 [Bdellovibrionota bacterium FG-1]
MTPSSCKKGFLAAVLAWGLVLGLAAVAEAQAGAPSGAQYLSESRGFFANGQYFKAARYAFAAGEADASIAGDADAQVTLSLVRANLRNAASYFFIRTLQSGNKAAIRRVLSETQDLFLYVGGDLLRKYLVRHTSYEDYDALNLGAYLYSLAKDALLSDHEDQAVGYLSAISNSSPLWPFALQLRGTAFAILQKPLQALEDFRRCQSDTGLITQSRREADDLHARCQAGEARTLYEMERFDDADQAYDRIAKRSLVWPDILFEQAWNAFGRREYNRTLGKLVSYKSPALSFVFNTEADVLRAQAFLGLCLYKDANDVIDEFNGKYVKVGEAVKEFVENNSSDLPAFYKLGKEALLSSLYSKNAVYRMTDRFVRGPYFQGMVAAERSVGMESAAIRQFSIMQPGVEHSAGRGFPGFLDQVLSWRLKTIRMLGGAFVKNSLMDYHSQLIADFEKMAFIKLEMLKQAKDRLIYKNTSSNVAPGRARGNIEPSRRDYQYYWSFNGEFWNDELGDYVFGLESECRGGHEN